MNKSISMILYNTFTNDSRVLKEAETLQKYGYSVTVHAFYQKNLTEKYETLKSGVRISRKIIFPKQIKYFQAKRRDNKEKKKFFADKKIFYYSKFTAFLSFINFTSRKYANIIYRNIRIIHINFIFLISIIKEDN